MKLRYEDIFSVGALVALHVGQWRARKRVRFDDLGIDKREAAPGLGLGAYKLVDFEEFDELNKIAGNARRLLNERSVTWALQTGTRFVPAADLVDVLAALSDLTARYATAADEFVTRYAAMVDSQLPVIDAAIRAASKDRESADQAIERVRSYYPSAREVRECFAITVSTCEISPPRNISEDLAAEGQSVRLVVREMIEELREQLGKRIAAIVAAIERGGKVPKIMFAPTRELLDRLSGLNVARDATLERQISDLRRLLASWEVGGDVELPSLANIAATLEMSAEAAVADAEAKLGGVGRRKLALVGGGGN